MRFLLVFTRSFYVAAGWDGGREILFSSQTLKAPCRRYFVQPAPLLLFFNCLWLWLITNFVSHSHSFTHAELNHNVKASRIISLSPFYFFSFFFKFFGKLICVWSLIENTHPQCFLQGTDWGIKPFIKKDLAKDLSPGGKTDVSFCGKEVEGVHLNWVVFDRKDHTVLIFNLTIFPGEIHCAARSQMRIPVILHDRNCSYQRSYFHLADKYRLLWLNITNLDHSDFRWSLH